MPLISIEAILTGKKGLYKDSTYEITFPVERCPRHFICNWRQIEICARKEKALDY